MVLIYTILFEADKHWGAIKAEEQYRSSYIVKRLLADLDVQLFVNLGDFFDTKLLLNSKSSVYAIRDMYDKAEICRQKGIPMRVIRGTLGHDYDQLEVFNALMNDETYDFKYFNYFTIEETLPKLVVAYCPDETMNFTKWCNQYYNALCTSSVNLACCHGNFDVVLPNVCLDTFNQDNSTTLAYNYSDIIRVIKGPIIAGHWHDGKTVEHLTYVGSPDRWIFGEDEEKGYLLFQYDTTKHVYRFIRIPNFLASKFKTYEVYTSLYRGIDEYQLLISAVEDCLRADPSVKIKIKIVINELLEDTETQILNLKYHFGSNRRVVIDVTNLIKEEQKREAHKEVKKMSDTYSFIREKGASSQIIAKKIWKWIQMTKGKEHSLQQIEGIIGKELEDK